jgi:hypothetical protein
MTSPSAPSAAPLKGPLVVLLFVVCLLAAWGVSMLLENGQSTPQPVKPPDVASTRPEATPRRPKPVMTFAPPRPAATPDTIEGVVRDAFGNALSDVTIQDHPLGLRKRQHEARRSVGERSRARDEHVRQGRSLRIQRSSCR